MQMKSDYFDLLERAISGVPITKEEWDFDKIAVATKAIVTKYDLKWN